MSTVKIMLIVAIIGHLLCGICDCLLIYLPGGRFQAGYMKDNRKLSAVFRDMPLNYSLFSMLLGCLAMFLFFFGYIALCLWMEPYSRMCAFIMLIGSGMIFTFGMAHHVFCGMPEWLYVRMGRTEEARQIITEFFRKTVGTMIVCYIGFLIFGIALFVGVVTGMTQIPRWACIFNILPLMIILMPTRIGGSGNWAGAIMFLGLLFLI